MRFGISLPVLGQQQFIGDALRSLKAQSVDYRLAVMDATPGEAVQNVIGPYSNIIAYSRHGPDAGQAAAIKEGWERLDAGILSWLCADDYYFPYTLAEVRHIFETRQDTDVVYGNTVFADEEGRFLSYFPEISADMSAITKGCCISQPSCFVRREAVERVGSLATDLHFVMDWDLWTRLYLAGAKFYYFRSKPLAVCRMYEGTKTASRSRKRYREIIAHLKTHTGYITRLQSLIGVYSEDVFTKPASWMDWIAYGALWSVRQLSRWGAAMLGRQADGAELYGFEKRTNRVRERGAIWLPWFEETDRCLVHITIDRAVKLHMAVPGGQEDVVVCKPAGKTYKGSMLIESIEDQLVHLFIRSGESDSQWRLKAVELRPVSDADAMRRTDCL